MTARIPYRPEVDGLRAVAVLAVVVYHLDSAALPGGFVGVDCFFAISGFLIFSLLYQEQQVSGSIDWVAFFARRVTRLLPEACVLIVAVLIAGHFILLPIEEGVGDVRALAQRDLAESGAAAALWSANVYFSAVGIGYFHPGVWREPLVHLWSLGVEEQFYLAVPVMFLLAAGLARATTKDWTQSAAALLGVTFIASLAVALWWSEAHPWSAYYMLPTRAYEFVVGAAAALWLGRPGAAQVPARAAPILSLAGVAAVGISCLWLSRDASFPGFLALLPTVGTTMAIVASGPATSHAVRRGLTLRGVTYLGKISYGWYLWHWPMLVFWREYWLYDVSVWSEAAVICAALVPAAVGYHAVARLRQRSHASDRRSGQVLGLGLAGVAATLVACGVLRAASHFEAATPEGRALNARLKDRWTVAAECVEPKVGELGRLPECAFGDRAGAVTVVLWGDSHALHWLPALDPLLKELHMRGILRAHAGCPSGFAGASELPAHLESCSKFSVAATADVLKRLNKEAVIVLLFSRWAAYVNDQPYSLVDRSGERGSAPGLASIESSLTNLVARLTQARIPVGIALPMPELRFEAPNCLYRLPAEQCGESRDAQRVHLHVPTDMINRVALRHGVALLDPAAFLCTDERCPATVDGKVLYFDDDHLSGEGARYLSEPLRELVLALAASAHPVASASEPPRAAR